MQLYYYKTTINVIIFFQYYIKIVYLLMKEFSIIISRCHLSNFSKITELLFIRIASGSKIVCKLKYHHMQSSNIYSQFPQYNPHPPLLMDYLLTTYPPPPSTPNPTLSATSHAASITNIITLSHPSHNGRTDGRMNGRKADGRTTTDAPSRLHTTVIELFNTLST